MWVYASANKKKATNTESRFCYSKKKSHALNVRKNQEKEKKIPKIKRNIQFNPIEIL